MDPKYEKRLEAEIDRELKRLPEIPAPATLSARVLAAIAQRARIAWYRQSWQVWPGPLQAAFLLCSIALVGALGFALWELSQTASGTPAWHHVTGWFAWAGTIWNAIAAVLGAVALAAKQLGLVFFAACLLLLALAWAACVGLSTVYFRLALARR